MTDLRVLGLAFLLAGCARLPAETPETIAAREPVLAQRPVRFGQVMSDPDTVSWTGVGLLTLTPSTLYVTFAGGSFSLSYAVIEATSRRALRPLALLTTLPAIDDLLVVTTSRPICGNGCVFEFRGGGPGEAIELIENRRRVVDPFGRSDGPQPVWLSAGHRGARSWWAQTPEYLNRTARERREAIDAWFCSRTGCRGEPRTAAVYGEALRTALLGERHGYEFRPLAGVSVTQRTHLDTGSLLAALKTVDPGVNRLLVSDLVGIELRERISADYVLGVEATFRSFVDYYDLQPSKDGAYFIETFVAEKTIDDWLDMSTADFDGLVAAAARRTADRVLASLTPESGSGVTPAGRRSSGRSPAGVARLGSGHRP